MRRCWKGSPTGATVSRLWSALDPPDGLFLDITGAAHLFGGEAAMLAPGARKDRRPGLCRAGRHRRHLAWRRAPWRVMRHGTIAPPGGEAQAAGAACPSRRWIAAKRSCARCSRAGLKTIAQVAERGRAANLAARFGADFVTRLEVMLGAARKAASAAPALARPDGRAAFRRTRRHRGGHRRHRCSAWRIALSGMLEREGQGLRHAGSRLLPRRRQGGAHRGPDRRALARCRGDAAAVARKAGCAGRSAGSRLRLRPDPAGSAAGGRNQARHHQLRQQRKCPPPDRLSGGPAVGALWRASRAAFRAAGHPYSRSRRAWPCRRRTAISTAALDAEARGRRSAAPAVAAVGKAGRNQRARVGTCRMARRCASAGGGPQFDVARAEGPERIAMEWWRRTKVSPAIISGWKRATASVSGSIATAFITQNGLAPRWYLQGIFA